MISGKLTAEIHQRCARRRALLEACVEADDSRTFTAEEIEADIAEFHETLTDRAHRGVELIPAHE